MRIVAHWIVLVFLWSKGSEILSADVGDTAVLRSFLKGLENGDLLKWGGDDACAWQHIKCQGTSVIGIAVESIGLRGTLTPDLNKLSNLQYLGLQFNNLGGPLPSLRGLKNLQVVYMNSNAFTSIPLDFFTGLESLSTIYLDHNPLNKTTGGWILPDDVAKTKLSNLSLTNTSLTGTIPSYLGSMPSLKVLNLAYNKLSGGIPPSFASSGIFQLQANDMMGPVLSGPIDAVGGMLSLSELWLQGNRITGTIPEGLSNAVALRNLKLNGNALTGTIPSNFSQLPLQVFTLDNNRFVGAIPAMKPGVLYSFSGNNFCQTDPGKDCAPEVNALLRFIGDAGYPPAVVASWSGNNPCDSWQGVVCDPATSRVVTVNLRSSGLIGNLSPAITGLASLQDLSLSTNNLTGPIPPAIGSMKLLQSLDLSNNDLSAPMIKFDHPVKVNIDGNPKFATVTPPQQSSPPIQSPPLQSKPPPPLPSSNSPPPMSPPLPSPPLPSSPDTSSSPSIAPPLPPLTSPETNHSHSGPSPGLPGSTGSPGSPGSSGSPGSAGLSEKRMGSSRDEFPVIAVAVPVAGAISVALLASILVFLLCCRRNEKLKSESLLHSNSTNNNNNSSNNAVFVHPRDSHSDPELARFIVNATNDNASNNSRDIQVVEAGNLVISIQVLRHATREFAESSILGRGGFGVVYRGELDDGTAIAVKRMEASSIVSSKGLNEFKAEIAVLTKVRHRHLVALLGYCIDGNEKLLVYEYLPRGTLGQNLFENDKLNVEVLDWKKRLVIALDVARGMEYLHGLAHRSFIHRDLKPSNILLDDDYRAKVSDFGLVKLAPEGQYSIETRLAGTFGYLAPEYAVTGRVTTKADVFSFGVVLMELITGRRALDETQAEENVHLVTWFRRTCKECLKEMVDKTLIDTIDQSPTTWQSICTVAELAGHCTAREPYQRPDMGHAVSVLAPLVDRWKPSDADAEDSKGIDLNMTLPQALKKWQASEGEQHFNLDDDASQSSLPTRPVGFADSFTSADGR